MTHFAVNWSPLPLPARPVITTGVGLSTQAGGGVMTETCSHVYTVPDGYEYCNRTDVEQDGTVLSCPEHRSESVTDLLTPAV